MILSASRWAMLYMEIKSADLVTEIKCTFHMHIPGICTYIP